jgi:hypothetical protein
MSTTKHAFHARSMDLQTKTPIDKNPFEHGVLLQQL